MTTALFDPRPIQKHPRYRVSIPVDVILASGDVRSLQLEDISLGGVFIRTHVAPRPGSFVRVRLPLTVPEAVDAEATDVVPVALMATVVHVIDDAASRAKGRHPGMGLMFDGLAPSVEAQLARFVDALHEEERRARASAARFTAPDIVEVPADRGALTRLWAEGLSAGVLRARGEGRRGNRVVVVIGDLRLAADVVDVTAHGASLRLLDLIGPKRDALRRFVEGEAERLVVEDVRGARADLQHVLGEARRVFQGLEAGDDWAALGLEPEASVTDVVNRAKALRQAFLAPYPGASAPQRSRLEQAKLAVDEIEPALLSKLEVVLGEEIDVDAEVEELVAEAEFLQSTGCREEAQRALLEALTLSPHDEAVKHKLAALNEAIDTQQATALLEDAERMGRTGKIARARQAGRLSSSRTVLLRSMRMLASAGAMEEMLAVAQHLVDLDPSDELPLFAMLQVHERAGRWSAAARAAEALLRIRPDDLELHERAALLVARARGDAPPDDLG